MGLEEENQEEQTSQFERGKAKRVQEEFRRGKNLRKKHGNGERGTSDSMTNKTAFIQGSQGESPDDISFNLNGPRVVGMSSKCLHDAASPNPHSAPNEEMKAIMMAIEEPDQDDHMKLPGTQNPFSFDENNEGKDGKSGATHCASGSEQLSLIKLNFELPFEDESQETPANSKKEEAAPKPTSPIDFNQKIVEAIRTINEVFKNPSLASYKEFFMEKSKEFLLPLECINDGQLILAGRALMDRVIKQEEEEKMSSPGKSKGKRRGRKKKDSSNVSHSFSVQESLSEWSSKSPAKRDLRARASAKRQEKQAKSQEALKEEEPASLLRKRDSSKLPSPLEVYKEEASLKLLEKLDEFLVAKYNDAISDPMNLNASSQHFPFLKRDPGLY